MPSTFVIFVLFRSLFAMLPPPPLDVSFLSRKRDRRKGVERKNRNKTSPTAAFTSTEIKGIVQDGRRCNLIEQKSDIAGSRQGRTAEHSRDDYHHKNRGKHGRKSDSPYSPFLFFRTSLFVLYNLMAKLHDTDVERVLYQIRLPAESRKATFGIR